MPIYRASSLLGRKISTSDGEVGTLYDVHFSDHTWLVEHLIVETGTYFHHRRLIVDPSLILPAIEPFDPAAPGEVLLDATRDAILASPDYATDPSVADQKANDPRLHPRFLWMPAGDSTKLVSRPLGAPAEDLEVNDAEAFARGHNPHLRSFREVRGYAVYASGTSEVVLGHVKDLMVMSESHSIVQMLINMGNGLPEDELAVQPCDVDRIDWADVHVYLHRTHAEMDVPVV